MSNQTVLIQSSAQHEDLLPPPLAKPICWHEGMLLSPQHFQQNQQYWEGQIRQVVSLLSPSYWGVSKLKIDRAALLEGEISILHLSAMMPDGLLIEYNVKSDRPLALLLDDDQDTNTIQLAVPIQVPGSASERTQIQRYSSREDSPRMDENTGDNEIVMPRLHAKLSLQAGDRISSRFISLPLLRILKAPDGSFQLDPQYSPPLLSIGADDFRADDETSIRPLQQSCQALALAVRQKARLLAGLSEDGEQLGRNITQRHHRWIRAMVQNLVCFEQLADISTTSPCDLYKSLISMVGPISELDPNNIPPRFTSYNHDNAWPGFQQVLDYIHQQIDRVNLNYTSIAFEEDREGVFTLNYDKLWQDKDLLIELKVGQKNNPQGVTSWFESCRIASSNLYRELQKQRTLGAKAIRIDSDEKSGIIPAPGNLLFRIKANKAYLQPGTKLLITSTNNQLSNDCPAAIILHMPHDK